MGKSLVITEKPSVARDIVAALGGFTESNEHWESDDYVVTFSVGHIVELLSPEEFDEKWKRWTLEVLPILPEGFRLKEKADNKDRVKAIRKLLEREDVDEVVNACDAGREGELIFREIVEFLESPKPTKRLWLQSMTPEAIRDGFASLRPGSEFDGLGAAAECRSRSDWLIGMNATRALTRRLQSRKEKTAWSAGRVQTPTLALIVDRELEVLAHVPKPYWRLEARFEAAGHEYSGSWFDPGFVADEDDRDHKADRLFDENRARQIIDRIQGAAGAARETRKPSREAARPLFDLTSLQREANGRFGWSARRTLRSAQRLYEHHKLLTYPRTDSRALPNDYRATVDETLEKLAQVEEYAQIAQTLVDGELQNTERTFDDSKVSDHFAIIPTGNEPDAELSGDDKRLFDLVARRFMANFYPPAIWNRVERITEVDGEHFRSHSKTLEDPGWYAAMGRSEDEDEALPPLVPGETESEGVSARTLDVEQIDEQTKPLPRITEARLLSLMENAGKDIEDEELADALHEKGIGTPATRADVIENLIAKGYLLRVGKSLRPTVKGIRLIDVLRRVHIDRLASPELTGELEFKLRQVEHGERTRESFMDEIVEYTLAVVDRAKTFSYDELYPSENPLGFCPLCKRPVYERSWFYRCLETEDDDEDCPFRIWKDKSGRYMDPATVRTLLEKGETGEIQDFTWRNGRTYNGILRIEDHELKLDPIKGSGGEVASDIPEYDVDERPLGACPLGCGSEVIETPTQFRCKAGLDKENELAAEAAAHKERTGKTLRRSKEEKERNKACPWVMPRTVCKREIMRDEAEHYMKHGRTELLQDFTSQYGRPFAATLVLKPETGRHGFEFQPRKKAAAGDKKKAGRKVAGKKATGKKSTRKKTTRKKVAKSAKQTGKRKATRKTAKSPRKKAARKKG